MTSTPSTTTNAADNPGLMTIDLDGIVRTRLRRYRRLIPNALVRLLKKIVCQDRLNSMLREIYPARGGEFCRRAMEILGIKVDVSGTENLPAADNRRVIVVCNHPLGGLDGIALIDYFSRRYDGHVRFVVNDLLCAIEPLSDVFLPVNKHGAQSRASIRAIDEAMAGDDIILMFPAGLVSRRGADGRVADLEWQKMFVTKAVEYQRDVIPMYFSGENSRFFYNFALWRKRLGLKFNIEMIYLPREMFRAEGRSFSVVCGRRIPSSSLPSMGTPLQCAQKIKSIVYNLQPNK